jgi:hypothetical protein
VIILKNKNQNPQELIKDFGVKYGSDNEFVISENGELCLLEKGVYQPIANFTLVPLSINKTEDGRPFSYVFGGLIFDGEAPTVLPDFEVLHTELATKKWLRNHIPLGFFYMPEAKGFQNLKKFILKCLNKNLSDVINIENSGWHCVEGKWVYMQSGGAIGNTDLKMRLTDNESMLKFDDQIPPKEAFLESLNMLEICNPKVTYALLSLLLNSVITSPLIKNDLSPRFSMWIEGKTGMGKTQLTKMFTQIFESLKIVHVYDYRKDLMKNVLNRDCVSIFDDYGTAKTKRTVDNTNEKVEKIIRDIGDREPTGYFTVRPEGMVLFTGEKFLSVDNADVTSSIGRVIRVQMDNLFDKKQKTTYDPLKVERYNRYERTLFLTSSIMHYLTWVSEKLNSHFIENYRRDFEHNRTHYSEVSDAHSRQKDNFAHLTVSFNCYLTYGLEKEFITLEECASFREKARGVFWELLQEQLVSPLAPDVQVFMDALKELILQDKIIVTVKGIPYMEQNDVLGIVDLSEKTLSLTWQPVYELVVNHILNQSDRSEFISDIKLGKLLRDANLIYRSNDRVTKPVTGLNGRAIQFKTNKMSSLIEAIVENNKQSSFNKMLEAYAKDSDEIGWEDKKARKKIRRELDKFSNYLL